MRRRRAVSRMAGLGFELAAAIVGFALFGYWVGGYLGSAKWGVVIGSLLGIFGGMYNLIRAASGTSRRKGSSNDIRR